MFRRIEMIQHYPPDPELEFPNHSWYKNGIMGSQTNDIADAWIEMPGPKRLHKNCRFYFTELGWEKYGRKVVAACIKDKQQYRIIRIKECSVDVFFRDDYQVAVRPRKKK